VQGCRCRGVGVKVCRCAGVQGCRSAGVQGSRCAGVQGSRGAACTVQVECGGAGVASVTDLLFGKKVGGRNGLRHGNLFLDMIFFIFLKYNILNFK